MKRLLLPMLLAVAAAVPTMSAAAKLKGMNGRLVVFQCNFDAPGFNLAFGAKSEDRVLKPDMILSFNEEVVSGAAALISRKSDLASLDDRRRVFAQSKTFRVVGRWPGQLMVVGTNDKGDVSQVLLDVGQFGWTNAFAKLTRRGSTYRGSCNVAHLQPAGFQL